MIVVQRIVTSWTKDSRGAPAATVRNGVAEAFALPAVNGTAAAVVHDVNARERHDFVPTETTRALDRLPAVDTARLAESGWGAERLAEDPWVELQMAVDGVHRGLRDARALRAAVTPICAGVFVMEADRRLHVLISTPNPPCWGGPEQRITTVEPGHWFRWRFNARFVPGGCSCGAHRWWYEKWVVNVAYHAAPSPDLFTGTAPERVVGGLASLF